MPHTDIAKARAIRRAGHACEVCGTPVRFKSAYFLEVRPVFGMMFEADECCVLCERCWEDLDPDERETGDGAGFGPLEEVPPLDEEDEQQEGKGRLVTKENMLRAAREAWFTDDDPDGGLCA